MVCQCRSASLEGGPGKRPTRSIRFLHQSITAGLGEGLERWLAPFLEVVGRKTRRAWAPLHVQGLLGPEGRWSVQPRAARLGLSSHDQLHHVPTGAAWNDAPLWRVLAATADRLVGGPGAVLVIDDTALPKRGELSVGVARRHCGALGRRANCQVLVSAPLARDEVPAPVGLRLFLPEAWVDDPDRCARAGVPEARITASWMAYASAAITRCPHMQHHADLDRSRLRQLKILTTGQAVFVVGSSRAAYYGWSNTAHLGNVG